MNDSKWLWKVEGSVIFLNYGAYWLQEVLHLSNIAWPQQPLTEKVLISVKNWIFDDIFYKKGPVLVILVPGMIQPSGSVILLMK